MSQTEFSNHFDTDAGDLSSRCHFTTCERSNGLQVDRRGRGCNGKGDSGVMNVSVRVKGCQGRYKITTVVASCQLRPLPVPNISNVLQLQLTPKLTWSQNMPFFLILLVLVASANASALLWCVCLCSCQAQSFITLEVCNTARHWDWQKLICKLI